MPVNQAVSASQGGECVGGQPPGQPAILAGIRAEHGGAPCGPFLARVPEPEQPTPSLPPTTLGRQVEPDVSTARKAAGGTGIPEVTCSSPGWHGLGQAFHDYLSCLNGAQTGTCVLLCDNICPRNSRPPAFWTWLRVGLQRSECIYPKP